MQSSKNVVPPHHIRIWKRERRAQCITKQTCRVKKRKRFDIQFLIIIKEENFQSYFDSPLSIEFNPHEKLRVENAPSSCLLPVRVRSNQISTVVDVPYHAQRPLPMIHVVHLQLNAEVEYARP